MIERPARNAGFELSRFGTTRAHFIIMQFFLMMINYMQESNEDEALRGRAMVQDS